MKKFLFYVVAGSVIIISLPAIGSILGVVFGAGLYLLVHAPIVALVLGVVVLWKAIQAA